MSPRKPRNLRSMDEKREICDMVRKYISEGLTAQDAIKKAGINESNYYAWHNRFVKAPKQAKRRVKTPYVEHVEIDQGHDRDQIKSIISVIEAALHMLKGML